MLLILQALTLEPNHGLGIARRVEQMTRNAFQVNPGSLFSRSAPARVMGVAATVAAYLPARRAARVDLRVAIRCD